MSAFGREDLEFFAVVAPSPTGDRLLQAMEKRLETLGDECRTLEGTQLYRAQGKATELREWVEAMRDARNRLRRIDRPRQNMPAIA